MPKEIHMLKDNRTIEERKRDAKIRAGVNNYVSAMRQIGVLPPKPEEKSQK